MMGAHKSGLGRDVAWNFCESRKSNFISVLVSRNITGVGDFRMLFVFYEPTAENICLGVLLIAFVQLVLSQFLHTFAMKLFQ